MATNQSMDKDIKQTKPNLVSTPSEPISNSVGAKASSAEPGASPGASAPPPPTPPAQKPLQSPQSTPPTYKTPEKVWCTGCQISFHWSDHVPKPCEICTVHVKSIPGSTLGEKRNSFLALPIPKALEYDNKVPQGWVSQYIGLRVVSLFEHWKKKDIKLISGKSGLMQLQELCRIAPNAKALSASLFGQFLRGQHMEPCFVTLAQNHPTNWDGDAWTWVHALAPRIVDIWAVRPNSTVFSEKTQAYSITQCYYQDLGEVSKSPPDSFRRLFSHWAATIERRDMMA